ncbi:hypothetical protein Kpol_1051p37 [Vanderwaltozyma polyspora DSM 70294]|uniref:Protein IBD2 n=1 Tax=Vanderwaltozyma polyspora (strain ATCC 22028 / DSM 70294 / BCRC 21397 / CBS 2163 / NBRC 10782 / NRRL Y-8283 / UCD 57-17) TaxID=436907 RepID=IBD2_VANPO|nr:uncharacterized protein Kpol_1051p37 [Vanderwaltozyma polyspora DSM 70294]A7TMZ9.1 RecName: Full=Protein IBD2 [Vanderwaltozyma polyspora DSM 70294]EDO16387.1 hypothetical protein Kpol_1051p37 [Vanderwaltozyma polyspora DSM 70294]
MAKTQIRNGTSIEVVSEDGPLPINVMMQEGVKALTKILSDHLQDGQSVDNESHSMQFVFKNVNDALDEANYQNPEGNGDVKISEIKSDGESDVVNFEVQDMKRKTLDEDDSIEEYITDPQLHLDGDKGEIVFDYGSEIITDNPEGIGERISQMIESVLPNGFPRDSRGRLHAVVNGDELNITEETDIDVTYSNEPVTSGYIDGIEYNEDEDSYEHDGCCPHHHHQTQDQQNNRQYHHHHSRQTHSQSQHPLSKQPPTSSKYRNYNYHDYNYEDDQESIPVGNAPNFSMLMTGNHNLCLFCEYYMVFGEAPKNMIKWYNKNYGYDRLPQSSARNGNSRKSNR